MYTFSFQFDKHSKHTYITKLHQVQQITLSHFNGTGVSFMSDLFLFFLNFMVDLQPHMNDKGNKFNGLFIVGISNNHEMMSAHSVIVKLTMRQ